MTVAADPRPQTIGELLDRSIRAYLYAFGPFFIALGLIGMAGYCLHLLLMPGPHLGIFASLVDRLTMKPHSLPGGEVVYQHGPLLTAADVALLVADGVGTVLQMTIGFTLAAALASGNPPSVRAAFRLGLARLGPALVTTFIVLAAGAVLAVVLSLLIGIPGAMLVLLKVPVFALLAVLAALAVGVPLYGVVQLAWYHSMLAATLEGCGPFAAFGAGLRRTFSRAFVKRSLVAGATIVLLDGATIVSGDVLGDLLDLIPHLSLIGGLPTVLLSIVVNGVEILFVFLFARDARMRFERSGAAPAVAQLG